MVAAEMYHATAAVRKCRVLFARGCFDQRILEMSSSSLKFRGFRVRVFRIFQVEFDLNSKRARNNS
uniref:Uncharacterized protein n=1 Tax=Romanomermis culicivorax TaxID=13658 RepID=A0A915I1M4_ROMCU